LFLSFPKPCHNTLCPGFLEGFFNLDFLLLEVIFEHKSASEEGKRKYNMNMIGGVRNLGKTSTLDLPYLLAHEVMKKLVSVYLRRESVRLGLPNRDEIDPESEE
jgi:hypothetical protein